MSYILDAIRKSDLQRQRSTAPTLLTAHAEPDAAQPPLAAIYASGAVALLAAGIAIGWWRPWSAPSAEPPAATPVATAPALPAIVVVPIAPPPRFERDVVVVKPPVPTSARTIFAPAPASPAPQTAPVYATPARLPATAPASLPPPGTVDRATMDASGEAKTLDFADLPPAIRQEIPRMAVSVHAYSSQPKNRLVTIDDHMLHEGDNVAPGLKLEQITPDGLIFSFRSYRFRRSVKEIVGSH
jgi:general secretion pathway protein B